MHKPVRTLLPAAFLAALPFAFSAYSPVAHAAAATADTIQLEEVLVTARKREESLNNVPVAVSVIGGDQLRNGITSDLTKIGELAPQVSLSQGGSGTGAVITVRGVSSGSNDAGLDQSVAIEVDGVPISRGQVMASSTFDLQQVQVLQGPQALFFGKNSPAGVISLRSANPGDKFEAYGKLGYEVEAKERFFEGAISSPLNDTLKMRFAARVSRMDGWIKNVAAPLADFLTPTFTNPGATGGDHRPDESRYAMRLTLAWSPTETFDALFKLTSNSQQTNAGNATSEPFCISPTTSPVLLGTRPLPGADCNKDRTVAISSVAPQYTVNFPYANGGVPYYDNQYTFASLNLNKRFDAFTLTSTTGWFDQRVTQMSVSDWSPYATIWFAGEERYKLWTEELRVNTTLDGPVNFMAGVYYEDFNRPFFNAPDLFHAFNPARGNYAAVEMQSTTKGNYYSGFAQLRWNVAPNVELAAGARYSNDVKDFAIQNLAVGPTQGSLLPVGTVLKSHYSDDNTSPEVTLSWHPQPDQMLYVAYKTGYKGGGVSNAYLVPNTATPANVQFKPEKSKGVEAGYKATLLDRRLRFDLTGYRYNYDDLQVVSYNAATISFSIGNAAAARIEGAQGQLEWAAARNLDLRASVGYNRARYTSYGNAQCFSGQTVATGCIAAVPGNPAHQDLTGKALLRAPNLTYSLGADYKVPMTSQWTAAFSVQGSHTASFETATDYAPGGHQDGFWLLNAGVRFGYDQDRYEVALLGRNLSNTYYTLNTVGWSGAGNPNQFVGFFNRPKEVVLQLTARL